MEKLSFSVEDVNIVSENPNSNFAVVSVDFFASGKNLHNMYISEETLMRTANTIKNCPLVWKYDKILDDVYTHDKDEVPCGFVPESSVIQSRKLEDGRTMLSVVAYVWKRYTGELLNIFKRDGGKKPVSVEMSVLNRRPLSNGLTELLDYFYEGITVLGSFVTPAIPLANANVLSFSEMKKEYNQVLQEEFPDVSDSMKIPVVVKENAENGLKLRKAYGKGGTSVAISFAKYITKNDKITPEKAQYIVDYFSKHEPDETQQGDPPSDGYISSLLIGGVVALKWAQSVLDKAHEIKTEKWAQKNKEKETSMGEKINEQVAPAEETTIVANESPAIVENVEMAEAPKEEMEAPKEEEKEKEEEKKFEFPKNFNLEKMGVLFSDDGDEDDEVKMAKEEVKKGEFANPSVVMSGMFAKMCKMADAMVKMAEDQKVYMAENEALKKFKADVEVTQKNFEVEKTLKELNDKVVLPAEAREQMLAEAEKYSFSQLEEWKTYCKAKSFDFAVKDSKEPDVVRVGMPFTATTSKKKDDLWAS